MKKIVTKSLLSTAAILVLAGCTGNQINIADYKTQIKNQKVDVPEVCMGQYKSAMPKVAVVPFTNNSTFGKAEISSSDTQSSSVSATVSASRTDRQAAGFVVGVPGAAYGAGASSTQNVSASQSATASQSSTDTAKRSVDAKLGTSIIGPLEAMVVESGGATLFSRTDMDKINSELKFQDSGLLDESSRVEFGKLSGVKYLITGSIDNVEQNYRDNSAAAGAVNNQTQNSDNNLVKIIGLIGKVAASVTDGMVIKAKVTVKVLDVETGKIIFTKQLEESKNIGKIRRPNYDQVVGGIKGAINEALPELKTDLADLFAVKGYVTQIKAKDASGKDAIAQVNVGKEYKVKEGTIFKVYNFDQIEDPMSGQISCDVTESAIKLTATQNLTKTHTWTTVDGDAKNLKPGQLVKKTAE